MGVAEDDVDDAWTELEELDVVVPGIMLLELELEVEDIEDDRVDEDELIMELGDKSTELELDIMLEEDGVVIVLLLIL